jgi:hypothetical protein
VSLLKTVFPTVDERSSGPSSSVISCYVHSSLLQKEQQSVKGPDGVSTAGTPMPKLKSKRNIILRRTINQYAKSFIIIILKETATVFPYVLGNIVETQWNKLNVGLLLWDVFVIFSLFFPK